MYRLCTMSIYLVALVCICAAKTEVARIQRDTGISAEVNTSVPRSSADLPDILLKGMIIVKIKTLSYIRELSYPDSNLTRRLTALCEREMAKIFHSVKGKQTVKVESFRRGRWSAVILVMILDSTGNGNVSEISDIIKKNIKEPGKFINYDVDRRMASFRPQGVFCQPRVHYAFESSSRRNIYDDSGFDNNGVIYGTLEITRHGKCGKAAKFKNGYIYLRKFRRTKTSGTDAILVTLWMRLMKPRSSASLFRGYYKGAVVELFMERGILKWKYITRREAVAFLVRHTKLLKPRQWAHIVALYDPYTRKAKLYVDSELSNEADVRKGMIHWRFTSSLRFGMTSTEGYLDDLYVYDCILSERVLEGIQKDCGCQELCAPRGKNEFLIRMILLSTNSSRIATQQLADRVLNAIRKMFEEISGQQRVQTIGHRSLSVDSLMVDYSLQSIGNSDTRYLAGVMQPAITAGKIAGVELTSNEVSFIPLSGKSVCLSSEIKCGDGECINKLWKCDGEINCADGSDEVNCGRIIAFDCQSNEFACNRSRVFGISDCIDARYRCDGQLDCDDDSDERGCVPPKLISAPRSLLIIAEGETASCTCVASGVPHPKVSWYFKGAEVASIRGKISVTSVSGHGKLTIYNVGQEDSGDYICKISDNVVKKAIAPSCTIKVRAFGNVCRPPFFNSGAQRSDKCLRCFCHERTTNCRSAQLYTSKLISRWDCESCVKDQPVLVNERGKSVRVSKVSTAVALYWQLPTKYSGNKLTSYGGNLKFTFDSDRIQNGAVRPRRDIEQKTKHKATVWNYVREVPNNISWFGKFFGSRTVNDVPNVRLDYPERDDGTVSAPRSLNLTGGHSVYIVREDGTHLGSTNLDYLDDAVFAIKISEDNWKEPQRSRTTSRPTLLRVLSDIKYIFIKAKSSGDTASRLLSVILDTAVEEQIGEKVSVVEQCACPAGYSGLSCQKCATGYFRSQGSQTCVKCLCNNHSDTCHPVTGKCEDCAHNTKGVKCEICKPGYYGNATKATSHDCKKCNCPLAVETNTFSDLCYLDTDGKSTCSQCQTGYTGRNCEFCAQGYEGSPTIVGRSCYKVGNFSQCDLAGSVFQGITKVGEIQCTCKSNVVGTLCDTCREGTFSLQVSNPSGCERCFCSRKSKICTDFFASIFTIQSSFLDDEFKLATIYSKRTLPHSLLNTNNEIYLQRTFAGERTESALYWHLPVKFSGSKVASYGGFLEYTVTYAWNTTKKPSLAYDVVLLGKKFGIKYVGRQLRNIEYQNGRKQTYRVALHEKLWRFSSNSFVSKIIFVLFLGRIDKLLILATPFVDMIETRLHDVKLDVAVENKTGVHLPGIERCSCPLAYTGYSCESCAVGYTASGSSIIGRCVKCNCHGHSTYCHPQTGVCQDCQHNTTGNYCEKCKAGFYGNPTSTSCQPCPCPRVVTTNSSEPIVTCHLDNEGEPACDQCPEGHEGKLCDRCKESFTGNPKVPGGFCKPDKICEAGFTKNGRQASQCVPCECHSHSTQCDPRTGVCKDCKDNTSGNHCEICTRGFYGDARKGLKNDCKPCPCPLAGSSNRFSETCFLDKDGLPTCDACFEGYTGRRCERCSLNYTGNPSTPGGKCFKVPVELIPTLKIIPESLTVQEGDSAQFVCNVKSPRPTQIFWSKLGQVISKRATVEGNVLKFKSLQKQDGGTYLCTASNEIALRTAKSLLVVKKQQLSAVIVDVSPKSRYIPVGGTAKFSCTSKTSSRYSITWSRENNKPLPSSSHIEDGTLIISDAKLSDGGTYICTGKNVLNVDRAIISLHVGVVVKPQVSVTPRKQVVDVADAVKFRCSATAGFPAATLVWKRDKGRQLPQFSKFFSRTGIFKIIAASRRDEGEYMCTARNRGGESVMRVQLLVKGPNSLPKAYIRPSRVTVGEGATAFLHCDVTGDNPMDIKWRKYDGTLPRTAVMKGNYLQISRTTIRDRGRYVCTATNRYGEASAIGSLFVNKDTSMSPVVTIKPSGKVISVMEGKTLRLICAVAGNDKATVRWTSQSNRAVLSRNFEFDLVKIKIEDTGVYECTATTDKGEGKASVSVVVQRNDILPRVQVYPTRVTTRTGKSVTLQCKVSSRLPVVVTWSRADGSSLNKNYFIKNTVLEIRNLRKKDEGTYICVAENIFGASKATVELSVFKR